MRPSLRMMPILLWGGAEAFHDKDSFGMRGYAATWAVPWEKSGQRVELWWRWDEERKECVLKRRNIPPAKKSAKPGRAK